MQNVFASFEFCYYLISYQSKDIQNLLFFKTFRIIITETYKKKDISKKKSHVGVHLKMIKFDHSISSQKYLHVAFGANYLCL